MHFTHDVSHGRFSEIRRNVCRIFGKDESERSTFSGNTIHCKFQKEKATDPRRNTLVKTLATVNTTRIRVTAVRLTVISKGQEDASYFSTGTSSFVESHSPGASLTRVSKCVLKGHPPTTRGPLRRFVHL